MNACGFPVEVPWQARYIVSGEIVAWWMLYLARATAGDKLIASPAEMLLKRLLVVLLQI